MERASERWRAGPNTRRWQQGETRQSCGVAVSVSGGSRTASPLFARSDRRVLVGRLLGHDGIAVDVDHRRFVAPGVFPAKRVDFLGEALDIVEVAIDRREPDVRDLIEHAQLW